SSVPATSVAHRIERIILISGGDASTELIRGQLGKGRGAVADPVLFLRIDLAEGLAMVHRDEDRIVAEPTDTARRPRQGAVNAAFVDRVLAVGPGEGENAREPGVAGCLRPLRGEHALDFAH